MFDLGGQELILILVIVLLLFGGKKIPELMRSLGQGMREFRRSADGLYDDEPEKKSSPAELPAGDDKPAS